MDLPSVESAVTALSETHRPAAEVDLDGISHNVKSIKEHLSPSTELMVVVANGYGHGLCLLGCPPQRCRMAGGCHRRGRHQPEAGGHRGPILILGYRPNGRRLGGGAPSPGCGVHLGLGAMAEALKAKHHRQDPRKTDTGMGVWESFRRKLWLSSGDCRPSPTWRLKAFFPILQQLTSRIKATLKHSFDASPGYSSSWRELALTFPSGI